MPTSDTPPPAAPGPGPAGDAPGAPPGWRAWVAGARPRTLPAAVVPVAVGTGLAVPDGVVVWRAVAAAVVALALQVGTNYANDHADGVRGTDARRVGPVRLVASGAATPEAVRNAALAAFGVAAVSGLALAAATSWWLVAVGAACMGAGWLYTGGPRPYGYAGWGEVFVFVFFGLVATAGSAWVQTESLSGLSVYAGVPVGLLATALLVTNNLRDRPTDAVAGKRTLAVRLGDLRTRILYAVMVLAAFVCLPWFALFLRPWAALAFVAVPLARKPVVAVLSGASGRDLIPVLGATGRVQLVFGAALAVGLALPG